MLIRFGWTRCFKTISCGSNAVFDLAVFPSPALSARSGSSLSGTPEGAAYRPEPCLGACRSRNARQTAADFV